MNTDDIYPTHTPKRSQLNAKQEKILAAARVIEAIAEPMDVRASGRSSLRSAASLLRQYIGETL